MIKMHRYFHGTNLLEAMDSQVMDAQESRAYREAIPTIKKIKKMRLPVKLSTYYSRLNKLYRAMTGSEFVPMKITPDTWIINTPTPQEDAYARGLLTELYTLMTPTKKPEKRTEYEWNVEKVAALIAGTKFYFPLPDPVQGDPKETADKCIEMFQELRTKNGKKQ